MDKLDWVFYTNFYNDLKAGRITTEENAVDHYRMYGRTERRLPNIDIVEYLGSNDVYGDVLFNHIIPNSLYGINRNFIFYLINECKLPTDAKIAEIGCGISCLSLPIIKFIKQGKYYGIDNNKHCIQWCRQRITPLCQIEFTHLTDDNFILPCGDGELDFVFTTNLSVNDIQKYLTEIYRVLKTGGHFIFTTFLGNQTSTIPSNDMKNKTRIIKLQDDLCLVNSHNEQVIIYNDNLLYEYLKKAHFKIHEIIFGCWTNRPHPLLFTKTNNYNDIVNVIKTS